MEIFLFSNFSSLLHDNSANRIIMVPPNHDIESITSVEQLSAANDQPRPFFGDLNYNIFDIYAPIHGYLSIMICIMGIIANGINITILTRKELRSPTNILLMGVAVADLMVMIEYISYASITFLYDLRRPPQEHILLQRLMAALDADIPLSLLLRDPGHLILASCDPRWLAVHQHLCH